MGWVLAGHQIGARDGLSARHDTGRTPGGIPPRGNSGNASPGPTGIARLRPGFVRVGNSTGTNRNFPFDDHTGLQKSLKMLRGGPPSTGIAMGGALAVREGPIAITQCRPGEMP